MPVYLFTIHTYRSWMPNNRKGYVRRKPGIAIPGVLPPDAAKNHQYQSQAKGERVRLSHDENRFLAQHIPLICSRLKLRCHAFTATWSHIHVLVSWPDVRDTTQVRALLKRNMTQMLNAQFSSKPKWFSSGGSRKQIKDQEHFDYLVHIYLPSHRKYGGMFWCEGR